MTWWNLQYRFGLAFGKGYFGAVGCKRLFSISFSRTFERGLPKLENLLGCLMALICMLLLELIPSLLPDRLQKNFFSCVSSDSFWTPNLYSSSKFQIPRSLNFHASTGEQLSIAIINWSASAGLCFICPNFPLHLDK